MIGGDYISLIWREAFCGSLTVFDITEDYISLIWREAFCQPENGFQTTFYV